MTAECLTQYRKKLHQPMLRHQKRVQTLQRHPNQHRRRYPLRIPPLTYLLQNPLPIHPRLSLHPRKLQQSQQKQMTLRHQLKMYHRPLHQILLLQTRASRTNQRTKNRQRATQARRGLKSRRRSRREKQPPLQHLILLPPTPLLPTPLQPRLLLSSRRARPILPQQKRLQLNLLPQTLLQ